MTKDQKALMAKIDASVAKAVPFTTNDVAQLVGKPSDAKLAEFAKKLGLGKKGEGGEGGADEEVIQNGWRYKRDGTPIGPVAPAQ